MRFVKPLDTDLIIEICKDHKRLVTLEENAIAGGAGSGVNEFLFKNKILVDVINLGLPERFIEHGEPQDFIN